MTQPTGDDSIREMNYDHSSTMANIIHRSFQSRDNLNLFRAFAISVGLLLKRTRPNCHTVFLKPCPHCRRKVRLSPKMATVAENGETTATVAEFGNSRTFLRQCRQAFTYSNG